MATEADDDEKQTFSDIFREKMTEKYEDDNEEEKEEDNSKGIVVIIYFDTKTSTVHNKVHIMCIITPLLGILLR